MAKKNARRPYNTLGRRILAVLETGARKYTVLRGLAAAHLHTEKFLQRTLERLQKNGLIVKANHNRGGLVYELART